MIKENLTEYLQEFISPTGIKVDESSKAYSSAALAELGYKDGVVLIDGEKDGKPIQIDEGKTAIKGVTQKSPGHNRGGGVNRGGKRR